MFRKSIISLLCIILLCSTTIITVFSLNNEEIKTGNVIGSTFEPDDDSETINIYFCMPDEWTNDMTNCAGIYWISGKYGLKEWKDMYRLNLTEKENIFSFKLPKDVTSFVFTNLVDNLTEYDYYLISKAIQTRDVYINKYKDGYVYQPEDNIIYKDGLKIEDLKNKIYVLNTDRSIKSIFTDSVNKTVYLGDWFYYYGNGEYGITSKYGNSPIHTEQFCSFESIEYDLKHITTPTEPTSSENIQTTSTESPSTQNTEPSKNINTYEDYVLYKNKVLGDVNEDGTIDINDATIIQLYLADYVRLSENYEYLLKVMSLKEYIYVTENYNVKVTFILGDFDENNIVSIDDVTSLQIKLSETY